MRSAGLHEKDYRDYRQNVQVPQNGFNNSGVFGGQQMSPQGNGIGSGTFGYQQNT
jgi:hypothetical protein